MVKKYKLENWVGQSDSISSVEDLDVKLGRRNKIIYGTIGTLVIGSAITAIAIHYINQSIPNVQFPFVGY